MTFLFQKIGPRYPYGPEANLLLGLKMRTYVLFDLSSAQTKNDAVWATNERREMRWWFLNNSKDKVEETENELMQWRIANQIQNLVTTQRLRNALPGFR